MSGSHAIAEIFDEFSGFNDLRFWERYMHATLKRVVVLLRTRNIGKSFTFI
jgi:hypothetical protein